MISQILKDALQRPQLFLWNGSLDKHEIDIWTAPNGTSIPSDLRELWIATGGGDIFESEVILCPFSGESEYDVTATNEFYWSAGLDSSLLIFHVGTGISAVRSSSPCFVSLNAHTTEVMQEFDSLDAWYCNTVRKEYAHRYGLVDY